MGFVTNKKNFIVPGAAAGLFVLAKYKKDGLAFLLTLGIMVGVGDAFAGHVLKPLVGRVRPCHVLDVLKHVDNCSNSLSFPSNHAVNAFIVATLAGLHFRQSAPYLFVLACLVAISRVYLGQHYPTDVIGGAICGTVIGYLGYRLLPRILRGLNAIPKIQKWTNPAKNS